LVWSSAHAACAPRQQRHEANLSPLKGTYRGTAKRELFVEVLVSRREEAEPTPALPSLVTEPR
jgi:hypothetical protein